MGRVDGKVAIVTGAASGIGRATAGLLAREGARVAVTARRPQAGRQAAEEINQSGGQAQYWQLDTTDEQAIQRIFADVVGTFGQLDVLVNNAGIQFVSPIEEFPPEKWEAIIAINLSSAFYGIRAAVPGMKKRGWGRIINTASAHSLVASPFKSAYVSAKHGIAGLTKTVALEVATFKITCNCISPGYVWTPLVEHQIPETMKARNMTKEQVIHDVLLEAQPTKEFVTSEQVAALALFLCSDDAAQITGANLSIDGGWTAE